MSGGFFRGTSADQDTRFSNKQAKLLKTQKFPPELDHLVDMRKVKMDVIRPWIASRVTGLLGFEDEVLINFIYGLLDGKEVNGKELQISLTGFMEKNTAKFMKELWTLLLSAQKNESGVPQQFLDAKEEELRKKQEEMDRITNEIQKKKEKENREAEQEQSKKLDKGVEIKANSAFVKPDSEPKDSIAYSEDKESDRRNGVRGRNRFSSRAANCSPSSSRDKHKSRSVSRSPGAQGSSASSEYCSPKKRSVSPHPRHSPRGSLSPPRRRSYNRRWSRSPSHHRSQSPLWHRSHPPKRRRSPSPKRRRLPSPARRYRSPSPIQRRRSPSPVRRRGSPSPVRRLESPSPVRRRGWRSPVRRRGSPSPVRRRGSPSPVRRRGSPLPIRRRRSPLSPQHRRSRSPEHRRSPLHRGSPSPLGRRASSPVSRRSPLQRQRSPSPRHRYGRSSSTPPRRTPSPIHHRSPYHIKRRSPPPSHHSSPRRVNSLSPSTHETPSPDQRLSPNERRRSPVPSPRKRARSGGKLSSMAPRSSGTPRSFERDRNDRKDTSNKGTAFSPSLERSPVGTESLATRRNRSSSGERRSASPYGSRVKQSRGNPRRDDSLESDSDRHHKLEDTQLVGEVDDNNGIDSGSEESDKDRSERKAKRKHRRSHKHELDSDDYSDDSEVDDRKEAKRRRKEEKKLRKEEKRRRREERRRRREERRAEKHELRHHGDANSSSDEHEMGRGSHEERETESDQKNLEIELRKKALESLKAKKGISH